MEEITESVGVQFTQYVTKRACLSTGFFKRLTCAIDKSLPFMNIIFQTRAFFRDLSNRISNKKQVLVLFEKWAMFHYQLVVLLV